MKSESDGGRAGTGVHGRKTFASKSTSRQLIAQQIQGPRRARNGNGKTAVWSGRDIGHEVGRVADLRAERNCKPGNWTASRPSDRARDRGVGRNQDELNVIDIDTIGHIEREIRSRET